MISGVTNRILQAQQASIPPTHVEDEAEKAGREAEKELEKLLTTKAGIPARNIFPRLRIPNGFQTQRHEVDLVVVTGDGIYCIEVKNIGGEIALCVDDKFWERRRVNGSVTTSVSQFPNPVQGIRNKAQILRNHLMRAGICIHECNFFPRVVLMNKNSKVDELIETDHYVITADSLPEFLKSFQRPLSTTVRESIIPAFFSGKLSYSQIDQSRNALQQIGTWDVVELHGGRQLIGDFKGCTELSCERSEIEKLVFNHQRYTTMSSVWALLGYSPTVTVTLYKRNGASWLGHSTLGNVVIPYNKDVGFQIAGDAMVSKIPANDIHTIQLSK